MTEKANKYYKLYVQWTGSDMAHRLDHANARQSAFADHIEEKERAASGWSMHVRPLLLSSRGGEHLLQIN